MADGVIGEEVFGVKLDLRVAGADGVVGTIKEFAKSLQKLGHDSDTIRKGVETAFKEWVDFQKALDPSKHFDPAKISQNVENVMRSIKGTMGKLPLSKNARREQIFADFTNSTLGRALVAVKSLNVAFSEARGIYKFVEGIEKVNQRLLLLHYTSGIGVSSLKDMGTAAEAFGGSAQSIASAQEKLSLQIARARRGEGFGYLQESLWKYGFQVDLGWDANQMRESAIEHLRSMSDDKDALAFAQLIDPANAKQLMAVRGMSDERFQQYKAMMEYMKSQGDLTAGDGTNRAKKAADETQRFEMATSELKRAWEAVKDQIAVALLPIMTFIVKLARKFLDVINEVPNLINIISYLVAGISMAALVQKTLTWIKYLRTALGLVKAAQIAQGAAGVAGAAGAGGTAASGILATLATSLAPLLAAAFAIAGPFIGMKIGEAIVEVMDEHQREEQAERNVLEEAETRDMLRQNDGLKERWVTGEMTSEDIQRAFDTNVRGMTKSRKEELRESLKSFEDFCEMVKKIQKGMGKLAGVADEQLAALDTSNMSAMANAYTALTNNTSVDNSRTQNQMNVNINGAQDPSAIKEQVIEAGSVLLGTNLNSSGEK